MKEKLRELMERLKLRGMAKGCEAVLLKAEKEGMATSEALYKLLLEEQRHREETSLKNRLHKATIPWSWTIHSFPFERQPGVSKTQILDLAGLSFIPRADNLIFIGDPGVGKTGLAIALLRQAILSGYKGKFYQVQDLLDDLYASFADRTTPKASQDTRPLRHPRDRRARLPLPQARAGQCLLQAHGRALREKINDHHHQLGLLRLVRPF